MPQKTKIRNNREEASVYLKFFKKYSPLLVLPTVAFTLAGLTAYFTQVPNVRGSLLLEMRHTPQDINSKITIVEESVVLARSEQIGDRLALSKENKVEIYKAGPLLVDIQVSGKRQSQTKEDAFKIGEYMKNNYDYMQIGELAEKLETTPFYLYLLLGSVAGFSVGVLISLLKYYFDNF